MKEEERGRTIAGEFTANPVCTLAVFKPDVKRCAFAARNKHRDGCTLQGTVTTR